MSSWIDRKINLPFMGGGSNSGANSADNLQLLNKEDIELHLVKCQELRRLKTMRKKWFVLYENSDRSMETRSVEENKMTRRKTEESTHDHFNNSMSFQNEELDENDILNDGDYQDNHDVVTLPARLEYYDSEKKWRDGLPPKKRIILKDCFDINRKKEAGSMYIVALYTLNEGLDIVFDTEEEMEVWLDLLLSCKDGGRSMDGKIVRPIFDSVWPVDVLGFVPDNPSLTSHFQMVGPHRLCVSNTCLNFYPVGSKTATSFLKSEIRKYGLDKRKFRIILGSNSFTGVGELSMNCSDKQAAEHLKRTLMSTSSRANGEMQDHHQRPTRRQTRQYTKSEWQVDPVSINGRTRSYSDCNKKNIPLGQSTPTPKSHILNSQSSNARNRTISEGNNHDPPHPSGRGRSTWHKPNMVSGSPLSPGSFVSSESAGSSNSVDSDTLPIGSFDNLKYGSLCMTPSSEHPSTSTIIEESSAESCIDPANFSRNQTITEAIVEPLRKLTIPPPSLPDSDQGVNYTPVECLSGGLPFNLSSSSLNKTVPMSTPIAFSRPSNSAYASSPPASSGVHYSTLVSGVDIEGSQLENDYMMMESPMGNSKSSSQKKSILVENMRKPLANLGLDEDLFPSLNNPSSITSPGSPPSLPTDDDLNEPESSQYLVMSPSSSSGGGTLPKRGVTSKAVTVPSSNPKSCREEEPSEYVAMSPTSNYVSHSRTNSNSLSQSGFSSNLGASPNVNATSNFSEKLPLFAPLKQSTPTASQASAKNGTSDSSSNGYMMMSPVSTETDHTSRPNWSSEKFRANSVDTSGPATIRSKDSFSNYRKDIFKRGSFGMEDEVAGGWSPTSASTLSQRQPNYNMEDYELYEPPNLSNIQSLNSHQHRPSVKSSYIQISQATHRRTSPASSSSVISGTPNSTEGGGVSRHPPAIRSSSDDDLGDDLNDDIPFQATAKVRVGNTKSGSKASSSSIASRGSSKCIDIPGGGANKSNNSLSPNVSGQSSVASTTNSTTMASWLGSLFRSRGDTSFRNRSDSVPSRPVANGRRRHRTQSEGEPVDCENG